MACEQCIKRIDAAVDAIQELAYLTPNELPDGSFGHPLAARLVELAGHLRKQQTAERVAMARLLCTEGKAPTSLKGEECPSSESS